MSGASIARANVLRWNSSSSDSWYWRSCISSVGEYDDTATAHVDKLDHKNGLIALFSDGSYLDLRGKLPAEHQAKDGEEISIDDGVHYAIWLDGRWTLGQHEAVFDGFHWIAK